MTHFVPALSERSFPDSMAPEGYEYAGDTVRELRLKDGRPVVQITWRVEDSPDLSYVFSAEGLEEATTGELGQMLKDAHLDWHAPVSWVRTHTSFELTEDMRGRAVWRVDIEWERKEGE